MSAVHPHARGHDNNAPQQAQLPGGSPHTRRGNYSSNDNTHLSLRLFSHVALIETAEQPFVKAGRYQMFASARPEHWTQVIAALADRDHVASAQAIRARVNHQLPNEIREQVSQFFPAQALSG